MQDISNLTDNMQCVVDHQGRVVPGLGNSGRRRNKTEGGTNWGGKRIKSDKLHATVHWIHEDAEGCADEIIKEAVLKSEKTPKKGVKGEVKEDVKKGSDSNDDVESLKK